MVFRWWFLPVAPMPENPASLTPCAAGALPVCPVTPVRTRMINLFQLAGGAVLADLPGYGYAKISHTERASWGGACGSIFAFSENLWHGIIVDCRRGLGNLDLLLLTALLLVRCW